MSFLTTKGMLAKLLAQENLTIEHDQTAVTASFNTDTRVLTLPILQTEDENVYNLFCAHESSHAINTPPDWMDHVPTNVPFSFVNVIEDVRIEKMIQSQFPGLRRDFTLGYDKLHQSDFFGIEGEDVNEMNLIDRINLHFKLGSRALIEFSDDEKGIVQQINSAETFEDVCVAALKLSQMVGEQFPDKKPEEEPNTSDGKEGGEADSYKSGEGDSQEGEGGEKEESGGDTKGSQSNPNESATQRSFDESLKEMSKPGTFRERLSYVKVPTMEFDETIFSIDVLRKDFEECPFRGGYWEGRVQEDFHSFMSSIKRDVNFMVQQFEMKKSADLYRRSRIARTGVLDMSNLHNYKLTDDIFLRSEITPEGKSHGLVIYLDWSGSMASTLIETVKQLIILVEFCRKVQIPYNVYTFTSDFTNHLIPNKPNAGYLDTGCFHMVEILTSDAKKKQRDEDVYNLFRQAYANTFNNASDLVQSNWLMMAGTPLNNVLFTVPMVIDRFKKQTGAQKVSFVCITDGDSSPLHYWDKDGRREHSYFGRVMVRYGINTYDINQDYSASGQIAKVLDTILPDVTITNLYLGGPAASQSYLNRYDCEMSHSNYKKAGSDVHRTNKFWPMLAVVNPKMFRSNEEAIEVQAGANKGQIRNALKRFLKAKTSSKLLLTSLVDQFC